MKVNDMQEQWISDIKNKDPKIRRRAIVAMANAKDPDGLKVLKFLLEHDPEPSNRELARKAALHLWESLQQEKQQAAVQPQINAQPEPAFESNEPAQPEAAAAPPKSPPPQPVEITQEQKDTARTHLNRALTLLVQEDVHAATRSFRQAISLDPSLESDQVAINLARELTGLSAEAAIAALRPKAPAPESSSAASGRRTVAMSRTSLYALIGAGVLLAGLAIFFIISAATGNLPSFGQLSYENRKHQVSGYPYYLIPPKGQMPDGGWPVVVALHDYGGSAKDMFSYASQFTNQGIVFVVPDFGQYAPNPGDGPVSVMTAILNAVQETYPIKTGGVVLLGYAQGGTFAYRYSILNADYVYGVVTAGTPRFDDITPVDKIKPYIFTWGSEDSLQDAVIADTVNPLLNEGYNVRYQIIAGAGHEVTPEAIALAIRLAVNGSIY